MTPDVDRHEFRQTIAGLSARAMHGGGPDEFGRSVDTSASPCRSDASTTSLGMREPQVFTLICADRDDGGNARGLAPSHDAGRDDGARPSGSLGIHDRSGAKEQIFNAIPWNKRIILPV